MRFKRLPHGSMKTDGERALARVFSVGFIYLGLLSAYIGNGVSLT